MNVAENVMKMVVNRGYRRQEEGIQKRGLGEKEEGNHCRENERKKENVKLLSNSSIPNDRLAQHFVHRMRAAKVC